MFYKLPKQEDGQFKEERLGWGNGGKGSNYISHLSVGGSQPNKSRARAKVSPKPWEWVKTHEIGYCFPSG